MTNETETPRTACEKCSTPFAETTTLNNFWCEPCRLAACAQSKLEHDARQAKYAQERSAAAKRGAQTRRNRAAGIPDPAARPKNMARYRAIKAFCAMRAW